MRKRIIFILTVFTTCLIMVACMQSEGTDVLTTNSFMEQSADQTTGQTHEHDYIISTVIEASCLQPGSDSYSCKNCNFSQIVATQKGEHTWGAIACLEYQCCTKCNLKKEELTLHSTERGVCDKCGEYYISIENRIFDENKRHTETLAQFETEKQNAISGYQQQIMIYQMSTTMSTALLNSKISTQQSTVASLQTKLAIAKLDNSASGQSKQRQIASELQTAESTLNLLLSEKAFHNNIENRQQLIIETQNLYASKIFLENETHKTNIKTIQEDSNDAT